MGVYADLGGVRQQRSFRVDTQSGRVTRRDFDFQSGIKASDRVNGIRGDEMVHLASLRGEFVFDDVQSLQEQARGRAL